MIKQVDIAMDADDHDGEECSSRTHVFYCLFMAVTFVERLKLAWSILIGRTLGITVVVLGERAHGAGVVVDNIEILTDAEVREYDEQHGGPIEPDEYQRRVNGEPPPSHKKH